MTAIAPKNNSNNIPNCPPEVVYLIDDQGVDDDDDISFLYASPALLKKGTDRSTPISVEGYSYHKDINSDSSTRAKKRVIDLSRYDYDYNSADDDDVQVLNYSPTRKFFKGESSNSKQKTDDDEIGNGTGDDQTFMCDICVDEKPKTALFNILGCSHSYCSDCMSKYVASKLQENITNISCPVSDCDGRLEPGHCRSILPSQVFDRWGDVLCESLILASQRFYCPFKDCSALLVDDSNGNNGVITQSECPNCNRLFCAQCRVPWHLDISCAEFKKLNKNERERDDIMLMNLAKKKKWMRCPKCKFYVEKSQGCLFMRCRLVFILMNLITNWSKSLFSVN